MMNRSHINRSLSIPMALAALFIPASSAQAQNTANLWDSRATLRQAQLQGEQRYREIEARRTSALAGIKRLNARAGIRIMRNFDAFLALAATGNGAALAFNKTLRDEDRFVSGIVAAIAALYCLSDDNRAACLSLAADLAEMKVNQDRLEAEVSALTRTVGRRLAVENRCSEAIAFTIEHNDPFLGAVGRVVNDVQPGKAIYLMNNGFYPKSGS